MEDYHTKIYKVDYRLIEENRIEELKTEEGIIYAARLLNEGELVALPTETVYGLGADATNAEAVSKIYLAKGRPQDNPLIVHIASFDQISGIVDGEINNTARVLAENFWPGPLTIIMKKSASVPDITTAGHDSVAVRMPSHPVARAVIDAAGLPIAAPSANRSGAPSPTRAEHVFDDLQGRIPLILDGGQSKVGVESTVVDVRDGRLEILRPGGISREALQKALKDGLTNNAVSLDAISLETISFEKENSLSSEGRTEKPIAPGMKYRHYSPETPVYIIEDESALKRLLDKGIDKDTGLVITDESYHRYKDILKKNNLNSKQLIRMGSRKRPDEIAAGLFDLLRSFDKLSLRGVYIEAIPEKGLGEAVMNRLYKASSRE